MAVRDSEVPGAVLATRVVIGPVRTGYIAHHCRHFVLTTTWTRQSVFISAIDAAP